MSIKNYLQKKKDPEGYLQKRAHEILRELEDIIRPIPIKGSPITLPHLSKNQRYMSAKSLPTMYALTQRYA